MSFIFSIFFPLTSHVFSLNYTQVQTTKENTMETANQHCQRGGTNPRHEMEEPLSDCCGAELLNLETPICSECREHCDIFEVDPTCE
jgi:hypothetical protein